MAVNSCINVRMYLGKALHPASLSNFFTQRLLHKDMTRFSMIAVYFQSIFTFWLNL